MKGVHGAMSAKMTLERAVDLFLKEHIATTARAYRYTLRGLVQYVGPLRPLAKVDAGDVIEYVQSIKERPTVHSPATVNKHIKTIRTFFNWCVKSGLMNGVNPALGLRRQRQQKAISREKAMPEAVYEEVLAFARWTPRYLALVLFLGDTGCRIGGAAGLRWAEVDLEAHTALVTEKGEKTRPVFFGTETVAALRRWKQQCTGEQGDYVFQREGKKMTNGSLGQLFERICRRAVGKGWGPHSLRHRKGHQLADSRVAPSLAAKALGHSSVMTTMEFYYPEDWERVQDAMEKLARKGNEAPSKIIKLGNS